MTGEPIACSSAANESRADQRHQLIIGPREDTNKPDSDITRSQQQRRQITADDRSPIQIAQRLHRQRQEKRQAQRQRHQRKRERNLPATNSLSRTGIVSSTCKLPLSSSRLH